MVKSKTIQRVSLSLARPLRARPVVLRRVMIAACDRPVPADVLRSGESCEIRVVIIRYREQRYRYFLVYCVIPLY